jgi:DNA-binding response OmpR family regulator
MNNPPLILIVDDDWMNRELLEAQLSEYEVAAANSGQRALEIIQISPPDLVILDVRMPGMDGYELAARLRLESRTHDIPIMMLTGLDSDEARMRAFQVGADDVMPKPFDTFIFLNRVRLLLQLKGLRDELSTREKRLRTILKNYVDDNTAHRIMKDWLKTDA